MSWTKRQFIEAAYEEIGLASYTVDIQPEEFASALLRLDSMMAKWNANGIRIGYPLPGRPSDSDLNELTGVPDSANEAVYTNLALSIAPTHNKPISRELKVTARDGLNTILMRSATTAPTPKQLPSTMPRGAGHKNRRNTSAYFPEPYTGELEIGPDSFLETL